LTGVAKIFLAPRRKVHSYATDAYKRYAYKKKHAVIKLYAI